MEKGVDVIKDKKLPNRLSALIRMALTDLGKIERNKKYKVDMAVWHQPRTTSRGTFCFVCLAGAVIAKEFNARPEESVVPLEFKQKISGRLFALEYTRLGDVPAAVYHVY